MGLQYTYPSYGHAIIHVHLVGPLLYFLWKYPCPSPAGLMTSFYEPIMNCYSPVTCYYTLGITLCDCKLYVLQATTEGE